jgi:hypothetical protein
MDSNLRQPHPYTKPNIVRWKRRRGRSRPLNLPNTLRRLDLLEPTPLKPGYCKNMKCGDYEQIQRFSKRTKE